MNSVFSEQILADKLSKLNSTQQCIETLSHWCIFHRSNAEQVVETWDKQFRCSEISQKVPLLYLANDILQNSKRRGTEFVKEFWKVLPSALKEVEDKGDDRGKKAVSRLIGIWEERNVFGSRAQNIRDAMLGGELPPPLELGKKRSHSVRIVKRDSRSIRTKLSIGGSAEKIVSAFHLVQSECPAEDEEMSKCKSAVHHVKKMEKDVDMALKTAKDPSRKTLAKELEEEEVRLKQCLEKLKVFETNRAALVSQLRDALHDQESDLEIIRTQMQVAEAQVEEAANMRMLLDEDRVVTFKPSTPSVANTKPVQTRKSAAAIAAEVADKLTASSSSQDIMISALSSLAAEEAKNAALTNSLNPSAPFKSMSDPNTFPPAQNSQNSYQTSTVQNQYHSFVNPSSFQYLQPSGATVNSYDYGNIPLLPPVPPPPLPPSYIVGSMVPLNQQVLAMSSIQPPKLPLQQPMLLSQQPAPPPSFRPVQSPGMTYYAHTYHSQ